jgi:hypothetical protein
MKFILCLISLIVSSGIYAQRTLEGVVSDSKGEVLTGANVYIKGTYTGTITDQNGRFELISDSPSDSILVISFIGYKRIELPVDPGSKFFEIKLTEMSSSLDEVVITAGSFEASEENRAVLLNPIEIATTASSDGDIYGALSTFPGAQKQGESGEIIVRGGEAHETKTFIDGMLVSSPYGSSLPDLPSRGRFTPFMFNGVMFSTGGYSAEYGQALSSVLELQTPGIFDEDVTSISIMNVGVGAGHTHKSVRSAYSGEASYFNTYPYFAMAAHDLDWIKIPQSLNGKFYHRQKVGKTGLIKTDALLNYGLSELDYSNMGIGYNIVGQRNDNQFIKSTYNTEINDKWMLKTGVAYNRNMDITKLDQDELKENISSAHIKFALVNFTGEKMTFRTGMDANYLDYRMQFIQSSHELNVKMGVEDWIFAGYLEGDMKLNKKIALRAGVRAEYSTFIDHSNLAPRVSMAYKLNKTSQVSMAWGQFYQQSSYDYLKYSDQLDFERARHFLINYQFQKGRRVLRTEIYDKKYDNLITYVPGTRAEYEDLGNQGYGYARGIDIFWKDDETLKNMSYWISYSYVDSKRKYQDFPGEATPYFVSPHNLSLVFKYWCAPINTQFAATYTFSSGRSYFNPNNETFMADHTPAIHDLSLNASYITTLFGNFTVVHLSVSNVFGQEHIYSYRYSDIPDESGQYQAIPLKNHVRRTIILGLFISIN